MLPQGIEQASKQITEKWNGLSHSQKIKIIVGTLVLVATMGIIVILCQPKMKTIFSENIDSKSIGQVATILDQNGIKYNLINDSTNIQVEEEQYEKALMYTAMSDIPDAGMKFDDIINNSMSTTQTEMVTKNNEYKKQQLERTIRLIDGVKDARVELVIPEQKNAYLQSQVESRASVFLTLSKTITAKQCEGIASYLTVSVQNLDRKNIVIIDSQGNTLYSGSEEGSLNLSKQQEVKASAEDDMEQKIQNLLDNMYDDVRVSSNLILDFDQYQEEKQQFNTQGEDENRGVVDKETVSTSSNQNIVGGLEPGTANNGGNVPTYQEDGGVLGESKESHKDITYAPDRTDSIYIKNIGEIDLDKSSLSVNLFKNTIYREEEVKGSLEEVSWMEFREQNKNQKPIVVEEPIVDLIKSATGIKNVVVNAYENPIFLDEEVYVVNYRDYLPLVLIILALLVIGFILTRFRKHDEEVEVEPELEVEEMLKVAKEQVALEEIEVKETLETKKQIEKFVNEKPEAVANLLRNWLTDEDWE